VERYEDDAKTTVLIDTSPDLRAQLLDADVGTLDAVLYTHDHADHVHGLDDLRMIVYNMRARLPVWATQTTANSLISRFGYAFVQPEGSLYPPILDLNPIDGPVTIEGAGGPITFTPFEVEHGRITALGFRIADAAYLPDVSDIPADSWSALADLDTWIVDALRYTPHPTHAHVEKTLGWIAKAAPRAAVLTNMHIDIDYETIAAELPPYIRPAHDMLKLSFEV
jgi:phosphoribosyl 1,2-cyclic phosphate phosphodiesterase